MKKLIVAIVVSSVLVGCGEDKSPEQVKFEQDRQLLILQQRHEQEMKRLEVQKVAAENGVDIDAKSYKDVKQYNGGYNDAIRPNHIPSMQAQAPVEQAEADSGFSGGEMLLAGAVGAAAGYALNAKKDVIVDKAKEMHIPEKAKSLKEKANYQARKAKVVAKKSVRKAKNKMKSK
ncbi:hypothetical protein [Vibrio vulnificus]|uniref:hypothetical protein n=1 Tax=Vibrio vulnificus TaxID=672 RepID=UPI003242FDF4